MKATLFIAITLLLHTVYAQTCILNNTYTATPLASTSNTIKVDSSATQFQTITVLYKQSLSGNVEATVTLCAGCGADSAAFGYKLVTDTDGAILLQLSADGSATGSATTTGSTGDASTTTTGAEGTSTTGTPATEAPVSTTGSGATTGTAATTGRSEPVSTSTTSAASGFTPSLSIAFLASLFIFPKRWSFALVVVAAIFLSSGTADAQSPCVSSVTITIAIPATVTNFCFKGVCSTKSDAGNVTDYVSLFGQRFASLVGANTSDPTGVSNNCNATEVLQVPANWTIAGETTEAFLAIALHPWMNAYNVFLNAVGGGIGYVNGKYQSKTGIADGVTTVKDAFGTGVDGYKISNCPATLLITQTAPGFDAGHEIAGAPAISNFVTFNGFDYATSDNTAPSVSSTGCSTFSPYVDTSSEWQIAPDDNSTRLAVYSSNSATTPNTRSFTFGAQCVITAGSKAFNTYSTTETCTGSLTAVGYKSGSIYQSDVNQCAKIMMRRVTKSANTWVTSPSIDTDNRFSFNSINYALLDNQPALNNKISSCQANFASVPAGWRLATSAELTTFVNDVKYAAWSSTFCIATDGASASRVDGSACTGLDNLVIAGVTYYMPKTCGRVLLLQA